MQKRSPCHVIVSLVAPRGGAHTNEGMIGTDARKKYIELDLALRDLFGSGVIRRSPLRMRALCA